MMQSGTHIYIDFKFRKIAFFALRFSLIMLIYLRVSTNITILNIIAADIDVFPLKYLVNLSLSNYQNISHSFTYSTKYEG